jgi:hypothetical protein
MHIAERCRADTIIDAFCGSGGNAIQFAFTCERGESNESVNWVLLVLLSSHLFKNFSDCHRYRPCQAALRSA